MPKKRRSVKRYFHHGIGFTQESRDALRSLSTNLLNERLARGLRQVDLAKKTGCSAMMISNMEKGDNFPSLPTYLALLRALKMGKPPLI